MCLITNKSVPNIANESIECFKLYKRGEKGLALTPFQESLISDNELKDEISGLRQLLDCAAANIAMLVRDGGGIRKISRKDVREALGSYRLSARCDDEGNYILEAVKEPNA